jgi:gliding motility-associated-like protein
MLTNAITMRSLFSILIFLSTTFFSQSQTVLYSENFDGAAPWTLNVPFGVNGADPNFWQIDSDEAGVAPPGCGISGGTDKSLHITSVFFPTGGASYDAGGLCGLLFCPETHMRAESPAISTIGQTTLTLTFNYISNGQASIDFGSIWINTGMGWSTLVSPLATTAICASGQGQWTSYSIALPVAAENNPNLKIGFGWQNNDDGVGSDPSIAINNVEITTPSAGAPPVANFSTPITTICEGTCINFTNTGTYIAGATFAWNFGNTMTSALENPINICYPSAGNYTVSLIITDANGTDTETKTNYIVVNPTVSAGADNTATICNNTSINLTTLLSGANSGGTWTETTGTPSGQFNSGTAVFDANGLTAGNYTFNYTVNGIPPCSNDIATMTISVSTCVGPIVSIIASSDTICSGQSIIFNSNSTGTNISTYVWSFSGGLPGTANTAGPHNIIFNTPGTFNVLLQVTDDNGTTDQTIQIVVKPCSSPTAAFSISDPLICDGQCITYTNNTSTTGPTTYNWTFVGGSPSSSSNENPVQICYNTPGTYMVTLVATNNFGTNSYSQNINVLALPTISVSITDLTLYNDTINAGDSTVLFYNSSEGDVVWSSTPSSQVNTLNCLNSLCDTVSIYPVISTIYTATTTTSQGCTATSSINIEVKKPTEGFVVGVPNMFSPDGNGENDILFVRSFEDKLISVMIFRVFNRYGQLVFETTDPTQGWDGDFKGKPEKQATFVYTLEYTLFDGTSGKMNGNVTLVR